MTDSMDVVVVGGGPWSPDINFPIHHTARLLSRDHRVLYFYRDSHTSLLGHFAGRLPGFHTARELTSRVLAAPRVEQVAPNLWICALAGPGAVLPLSYPPIARWISVRLAVLQLRAALETLGFKAPLLWFYWWFFPEIADAIPHRFAVYDVYDDHSQYDFVRSDPRRVAYTLRKERALIDRVDLVFAVSQKLVREKAGGPPVIHLPNGVDLTVADNARSSSPPDELRALPRPIVGYLGSYDSRMDWALVEGMADQRPDWSLVFVGGGTTSPSRPHSNLHLLGNRTYSEALEYVNQYDVALIPFVCDALTESINPAKLFDYLALGKPVVSTPLPAIDEVAPQPGLVYQGATVEQFIYRIEQALTEPPALPARRRAAVEDLTWERRVEQALRAISVSGKR